MTKRRTTANVLIPYMRKSSGEDPALSLARQRGAIERWADANGVELAPEVWEPNVSGKRPWRERGLGEALARVERGEAAGIVCEEQSRLSRESLRATAEVWEALEKIGARLVCTAEGLDTAKGDHELSFAIRAALAREQWKQYARRMDDVKTRKARAGVMIGRVPLGYRRLPDKTLAIDEGTAAAVRELFERRASGAGRATLARLLEERTGRHWSREGVNAILRNRLYATGRIEYGGVVSEVECGAIVDEALWHAAQRTGIDQRPQRGTGTEWLLSGFLKCAACGYNLSPAATNSGRRDKSKRRYYRCVNRRCIAKVGVRAELIEEWVARQTFAVGDELETRSHAPDLEAFESALADAERRMAQVMADGVADDLGELWAPEVRRRREARDQAAEALVDARAAAGLEAEATDLRLRDAWHDLSNADRRAALGLFWREIRVARPTEGDNGTPVTFVARGPVAEAEVELPEVARQAYGTYARG